MCYVQKCVILYNGKLAAIRWRHRSLVLTEFGQWAPRDPPHRRKLAGAHHTMSGLIDIHIT